MNVLQNIKRVMKKVLLKTQIAFHRMEKLEILTYRSELEKIYPPKKDVTVISTEKQLQQIAYQVSFIVPVYNTKKELLEHCLNSLLNQRTEYSYQIIIVDDGSCQETVEQLLEYQNEHAEILLLRGANGGVGKARNRGIQAAQGKYFSFVDADDYIEPDFIEKMMAYAIQGYDIVKCGYEKHISDRVEYICRESKAYDQTDQSYITTYDGFLWGALYKRELFESVQMPEGYTFEDMAVRFVFYRCVNTYYYTGEPLYHYIDHDGNITNSASKASLNRLDHIYLLGVILADSETLGIPFDQIETTLLLNEVAFMLWYRVRKLDKEIVQAAFLWTADLVEHYIPADAVQNMSKKEWQLYQAFLKRDFTLWSLLAQMWNL